jgi:pimeloyl-ACP methyl ester carboxylesterase
VIAVGSLGDAGLASGYWRQLYTPAEVDAIVETSASTLIVSGRQPVHVRVYMQSEPAPTVLLGHGLLRYGLFLGHVHLALHKSGFNVVQFDMPGFGMSGGARGACSPATLVEAWETVLAFTHDRFGFPLYLLGLDEDCSFVYNIAANRPEVAAASLHVLLDPATPSWGLPAWLTELEQTARQSPGEILTDAAELLPWSDYFAGPQDSTLLGTLRDDPLGPHALAPELMHAAVAGLPPTVAFEDCRTPIQVVTSEKDRVWPYEMVVHNFARLGGPKELVTLTAAPHWDLSRQFADAYCAHAIAWFRGHVAAPVSPAGATSDTMTFMAAVDKTMILTAPPASGAWLIPRVAGVASAIALRTDQPLRVGREAGNELILPMGRVSRFHAVVEYVDGGFAVSDLGSRNGVYVNGERIPVQPHRRVLAPGDVVQFTPAEDTSFEFSTAVTPRSGNDDAR